MAEDLPRAYAKTYISVPVSTQSIIERVEEMCRSPTGLGGDISTVLLPPRSKYGSHLNPLDGRILLNGYYTFEYGCTDYEGLGISLISALNKCGLEHFEARIGTTTEPREIH